MSGGTLLDVLELSMGDHYNSFPRLPLTAPDPTAYTVFQRIFHPWIEEYHHYKIDERYLAISKVHLRLKSQCSLKSDLKDRSLGFPFNTISRNILELLYIPKCFTM